MAQCGACNTSILFGGVKNGDQRYCNANCYQRGVLLDLSNQLPLEAVQHQIDQVFRGQCPKCHGPGPVDVHKSFRVWSMLLMTSWRTTPLIACRSCGRKAQMTDALVSLLVGWWGFPWGLVMTPVQIGRNIAGALKAEPERPSPDLETAVRIMIASRAAKRPAAS